MVEDLSKMIDVFAGELREVIFLFSWTSLQFFMYTGYIMLIYKTILTVKIISYWYKGDRGE